MGDCHTYPGLVEHVESEYVSLVMRFGAADTVAAKNM